MLQIAKELLPSPPPGNSLWHGQEQINSQTKDRNQTSGLLELHTAHHQQHHLMQHCRAGGPGYKTSLTLRKQQQQRTVGITQSWRSRGRTNRISLQQKSKITKCNRKCLHNITALLFSEQLGCCMLFAANLIFTSWSLPCLPHPSQNNFSIAITNKQ